MMMFAQADMAMVESATKVFGPMGGACAALVVALVYVFKLYHAETRARIEDAKAGAKMLAELAPYLAKLARRIERLDKARFEDSDPPPPLSGVRIQDGDK